MHNAYVAIINKTLIQLIEMMSNFKNKIQLSFFPQDYIWFKAHEPFPSLIPWITSENRLPQLAKKCPLWPQRNGSA